MVSTINVGGFATGRASTSSTTQYWCIASGTQVDTTETNKQIILRSAGTYSNFQIFLSANTIAATTTFTIMKNTVAGNSTVSFGSNATGTQEDSTHTDAVVGGDKLDIKSVPGTSGTFTIRQNSFLFAATTNTVSRPVYDFARTYAAATAVQFSTLCGSLTNTGTEANVKSRQRKAGNWKNLACNITANTVSAASTNTFRLNGADSTSTSSITANTSGQFEDNTHSPAVVAGDDVCHSFVTGATGTSLVCQSQSADFASTNKNGICDVSDPTGKTILTGVANVMPLAGSHSQVSTTESNVQVTARAAFTFSELSCFLTANTITSGSNVNFRNGGANATQSALISASTAGVFSDSTHTDTVLTTDKVNYQINTGGTGTSITINQIAVWTSLGGPTVIALTETTSISESKLITIIRPKSETTTISETQKRGIKPSAAIWGPV